MASGRMSRMRASATRIFHPPDSAPTSPSIMSSVKLRPASTSRARPFERIAAELLEPVLRLAVALEDRVHGVGLIGIGHGGLEFGELRGATLTGPAPSITSATALRPAISPTSWLK